MALLDIAGLTVEFGSESAPFRAVDRVDLTVEEGEVVGIVGESGSGKSVTSYAVMGLVDYPGRVQAERVTFAGTDLTGISESERRQIVGKDMAMIFQEPMSSLNPCYTAGFQIMEALGVHVGGARSERRARTIELLEQVGIPDAKARMSSFPHQLSGGMNQRVMIAMAIACNPRLLIADEPTTALDVTIQAQILDLLISLQHDRGMALVLITHDLAVVAEAAQRVVVMYAGQVVETGSVEAVFTSPQHPYTAALLDALPERSAGHRRLRTIPGVVPGVYDRPSGCLLHPRCQHATDRCRSEQPRLLAGASGTASGEAGRLARCHTPLDVQRQPRERVLA